MSTVLFWFRNGVRLQDMACGWRVGAAWLEHQLLEDDVYSRGNAPSIAGRRRNPRGESRFDPAQHAAASEPEMTYQRLWATV